MRDVTQYEFTPMSCLLSREVAHFAQGQSASSAQLSIESADARGLNSKDKPWQSAVTNLKWLALGLRSGAPKESCSDDRSHINPSRTVR